jgi:hypothetical protein
LSFEGGLALFAIAQSGFELAFAKAQNMRADLESLLVGGEGAGGGVLLLRSAAAALVEGLHPESLGGVGYGFGQSVEGGGAGVQASRKPLPPRIQERVDCVWGAGAESLADLLDGGAFARAQESIGGAFDVAGGDAARGYAIGFKNLGHLISVMYPTVNVSKKINYKIASDNDSYRLYGAARYMAIMRK